MDLHPHMRRILRKLRLTQVLTGVFLKATDATMKRLLVVEPFITYGFPNFLMPFKLKCPERRLQMKKKPFKDGGDSGNREDKINELIEKLN